MDTVLIVIHLLVVVALVGLILMQRSEGGGLGIGGGGSFMSARGAANALTRTTAILAVAFFATSLGLSLYARYQERPGDIFDRLPQQQDGSGGGGILDQLGGGDSQETPATADGDSASPGDTPAASDGEAGAAEDTPAGADSEPQIPTGQ